MELEKRAVNQETGLMVLLYLRKLGDENKYQGCQIDRE
jgi:hypothetical protein